MEVIIRGEGRKRERQRGTEKFWRGVWDKKGREEFRDKLGKVERCGEKMETGRKEMVERIKKALKETEMERGRLENRKRGWWDEECRRNKEKVRRELKSWRREKRDGKEHRREKKEYKELCERKKEENDRWEKRAMEAKKESEVWEILNRERKRRKRISVEIDMREWKEYFMRLLGGGSRVR